MIPKIIHLCWLSGDPFPADIQECLDSWKRILPDYEVMLWDTKRFDINSTLWTKQAFENKKYAFAADYIRLYALYNYGGIYLDSDVLMYKSFDDLLDLPYFIGQDYVHCFEAAIIGAEKNTEWIAEILKRYDNRPFVKADGSFDMEPLPLVFLNQLQGEFEFVRLHKLVPYEKSDQNFYIFDRDFFNSRNSVQARRTKKSYCSHNYAGAWVRKRKDLKSIIIKTIPKWLLNILYTISHNMFNRAMFHVYEPKIKEEIY